MALLALTRRFFEHFRTVQSQTDTPLPISIGQAQLVRPMPDLERVSCTAALSTTRCVLPGALGNTSLLENRDSGPAIAEVSTPSLDDAGVPFQNIHHG